MPHIGTDAINDSIRFSAAQLRPMVATRAEEHLLRVRPAARRLDLRGLTRAGAYRRLKSQFSSRPAQVLDPVAEGVEVARLLGALT